MAVARPAGLSGRRMGGAHLARIGSGARLLRLLGSGSQVSGLHCTRERPFRGLLGPHRLASSERSGGVRATGGLGGAGWSGDPRIPPSLLAQSRSPLTWWSQKGLAIGVKAFTTLPLRIKLRPARFSQAARSPGSPGDLSCLVISLAGTPQSVLWPAGPALLLAVCSPAGP